MLRELLVAFGIVAVCVVIHVAGMLLFAEWLARRKTIVESKTGLTNHALLLILVFTVIIFFHVTEVALWAVFYWGRGLFQDFETALYFSFINYTTIGFGDVVLPQRWRLLGAIEGISGILLCGLSAAFIFAIVNVVFRLRLLRESDGSQVPGQPVALEDAIIRRSQSAAGQYRPQ
jgi:Ion channel